MKLFHLFKYSTIIVLRHTRILLTTTLKKIGYLDKTIVLSVLIIDIILFAFLLMLCGKSLDGPF